jgi:hypothetical protein
VSDVWIGDIRAEIVKHPTRDADEAKHYTRRKEDPERLLTNSRQRARSPVFNVQ